MTTLFSILDSILLTPNLNRAEKQATLEDPDAIIRYAEKILDLEIDPDAAVKIQQVGLPCLNQIQRGHATWEDLRLTAQTQLND